MKTLSIVIPCYNEEKTIQEILNRVLSVDISPWKKEVIVVDDGSKDKTRSILKKFESKVKVIYLENNGGKGTALKKGLEQITGDYVLIQDADLEYNPRERFQFFLKELILKIKMLYLALEIFIMKREAVSILKG